MLYWIIAVVAFLVISGTAVMLAKTLPISKRVYHQTLVRTEPEKWGHNCSAPEHPEQIAMWNEGCRWAEQHKSHIRELHTENDGLKLYGQYFDFGSEQCVIILPGRCECHKYSYYFAEPYRALGFNVLVIDSRCHGASDGKYCTIGVKESEDLRVWVKLLTDKLNIRSVWLHSICVGSSTGLLLMAKKDCPKEIGGIVMEGCFTTFRETFKQHMIFDRRPLFPVLDLVMWQIHRHTGTNVLRHSPLRCLRKIEKPVLFLNGKEDVFSLPKKSQWLFEQSASKKKQLVWFEHGSHSHLRLNNVKQYDNSIAEFIKNV